MLMPDTNYGNLSAAVITSAGATSSTSIEVASADGAILPAAPFFATIMATGSLANANNSEIVKVTAKSTAGGITTLTITRAQRGTSAVSWAAGEAILANAIYTEDVLSQSQGYYQAVLSSGALFTITNASAPTTPVIGSRIRLTFDTTIPTAETVTLAINGGTAYEVDCHGATFATVGSVTNKVIIATNKVYTLEFDGTRWLMSNIASTILSSDITDGAITTSKIANAAVTSSKIDFTTLKPRWKVVATSTSQSVTIPAGYRKYRISFGYTKPNGSWGTLVCAQKTSSSWIYIQGVQNAQWIQAERECQSSDKAVVDLSRTGVAAGLALYTIDLMRTTKTATSLQGTYQATCEGSLTYVTGKIGFSVTNGSNSFTLSPFDAGSNYSWAVEAFDE